jgi:hypothetical protein
MSGTKCTITEKSEGKAKGGTITELKSQQWGLHNEANIRITPWYIGIENE